MMYKFSPIKTWFATHLSLPLFHTTSKTVFNIPIQSHLNTKKNMPIHITHTSGKQLKINKEIIDALGGISNIETYHEIPNSRRIRLTLINPSLIDNDLLEELDVRMFIRIGKRIVHIIP